MKLSSIDLSKLAAVTGGAKKNAVRGEVFPRGSIGWILRHSHPPKGHHIE